MTPAARVAAAIEILDSWRNGLAAERALTRWARQSRYAGSKDRAAVRDYVFDVLRSKQTAARLGGGDSGRALLIGILRAQGIDLDKMFTGVGHAPACLTEGERVQSVDQTTQDDWNLPDWLIEEFQSSLSRTASATAQRLCDRAPVTIRVNRAKTTVTQVAEKLRAQGIVTRQNALAPWALTVTDGARRLRNSALHKDGAFEFQDASSQAVVETLPGATKCLDFCAGGGGKSLALAANPDRTVYAHDIDPQRMKDIGPRAKRAGVTIQTVATENLSRYTPFDLVLCDAPCSGSGAWRRSPEAKWRFSPERLAELCEKQLHILDEASALTARDGLLAYATCSLLRAENEEIVRMFLKGHPNWKCVFQRRFDVSEDGDGFFIAHLTQVGN